MDRVILSTSMFANEFIESENRLKNAELGKSFSGKRKGIRKMYIAAFSCLLMSFATGLSTGFSAPAVYDMKNNPRSTVNPDAKGESWIASIMALGVILGGMAAGPLADKLGRKDTLVYNLLPVGLGWLIICYADTVAVILVGRFLCGLACGTICVVVPMYCVEISTADVRGILGSFFQGFLVIGNLLSVTVGAYVSWKYLALQGAVITIATVMGFCFMPESPRWYLMKNNLQSAIDVMNELQGGFVDAEKECQAIYKNLQDQPKGRVTLDELKQPFVVKPALITLVVMFFQAFCGMNVVFLFSTEILDIAKDFMDPKTGSIILGAVQVLATLISNVIVDKAGRRILLIFSGGLMSLSFAMFGAYYYKASLDGSIYETYGWIPLFCSIVAVIGYSFGYGPLPFLLSAEMLPVRVRSTVSAVVHVFGGIFIFAVLNTFDDMKRTMNTYGTFWFYSAMGIVSIIFVFFCVPETKGKRLEEIQDIFSKKSVKQDINITTMA